MKDHIIHNILYEYSYPGIFILVSLYFFCLYFGLATSFRKACIWLSKRKLVHRINKTYASREQIKFEIKNSIVSILVFGVTAIPIIFCIRNDIIEIAQDSFTNLFLDLCILVVWNEIHFFVIHRFMHIPRMMRKFHYVHHRSVVPTVYSAFSMHWMEAFLLSTVTLTIAPFISLSPLSFVLFPVFSILLNLCGHCNHRIGNGTESSWNLIATKHNYHHKKFKQNYGFASPILDYLFNHKISEK